MSARNDNSVVVPGGEPRVSLLPPELEERKRSAATRRLAAMIVFIAIAIAAVGSGAAWLYQLERQGRLDAARRETAALIQQQAKYAEVRAQAAVVEAANGARLQIAGTEVDWQPYLEKAIALLDPSSGIWQIQVATKTPLEYYEPGLGVLMPPRIGAVIWEVSFPNLASMHKWVRELSELPGYVDARPTKASWDATNSYYRVIVEYTFDEEALAHRYDGLEGEETETPTEPVRQEPEYRDDDEDSETASDPEPDPSETPNPSGSPTPTPSAGTTGVKR